jgi:hypothetical protein
MKGQAMFKRPEDPIRIALEAEIMSTFVLLNDATEPDVHGKLVTDVCKLMELRNKERISKDAIVAALTHIECFTGTIFFIRKIYKGYSETR